eukprot:1152200-Pelagomonas_calceolata.AAC.2
MAMQSEGWMAPGFGCPPPFKLFVAPEVAPPAAQPSASDPSPITSLQLAGSAKINGLDPAIAAAAVPAVAPRSGSTDEGAAAVDAAAAAAIGEGTEANGPEAAVAAAAGTKSRTSEAAGGVSQPHHPHRSLTPTPAALTVLAPGSRALAHAGNGSGAATAADEDSRTQAQLQALIRSKCQSLDISGLQVAAAIGTGEHGGGRWLKVSMVHVWAAAGTPPRRRCIARAAEQRGGEWLAHLLLPYLVSLLKDGWNDSMTLPLSV